MKKITKQQAQELAKQCGKTEAQQIEELSKDIYDTILRAAKKGDTKTLYTPNDKEVEVLHYVLEQLTEDGFTTDLIVYPSTGNTYLHIFWS